MTAHNTSPRHLAAQQGATTYVSGEACPKGHNGARYTLNGGCVECQRAWTKANRQRVRQEMAERRRLHQGTT